MPNSAGSAAEIRSEPRGPHWIAWNADPQGKPRGSIVFVGQTREEAETRARRWAETNEGGAQGGAVGRA